MDHVPLCPYVGPCWDERGAPTTPALFAAWLLLLVCATVATIITIADFIRYKFDSWRGGALMPLSEQARQLLQRARCCRQWAIILLVSSSASFLAWLAQLRPSIEAFRDTGLSNTSSPVRMPVPRMNTSTMVTTHKLLIDDQETARIIVIASFIVGVLLYCTVLKCSTYPRMPRDGGQELQNFMDTPALAMSGLPSATDRQAGPFDADNFLIDLSLYPEPALLPSPSMSREASTPREDLPLSVAAVQPTHVDLFTASFDAEHMIGQGSFGRVYRSVSIDQIEPATRLSIPGFWQQPCAIKHLFVPTGISSLMNELQALASCRHENILPVLGFCFERGFECLISPLMTGGSLDDRLFFASQRSSQRTLDKLEACAIPLTWQERLRILRDVARALCYLHTSTTNKQTIIHRDVKPSNILLDSALNAKLADLGVAKVRLGLPTQGPETFTATTVGSRGFIDPLYMNGGRVSAATDGYAFGVTLLVCITCRKAIVDAAGEARPLTSFCSDILRSAMSELGNPLAFKEAIEAAGVDWPTPTAKDVLLLAAGLILPTQLEERRPLEQVKNSLEDLAVRSELPAGVVEYVAPSVQRQCLVCMDSYRSVRFGCGHSTCCTDCADLLMTRGDPCPNCRSPIHRIHAFGEHVAMEDTFISVQANE